MTLLAAVMVSRSDDPLVIVGDFLTFNASVAPRLVCQRPLRWSVTRARR